MSLSFCHSLSCDRGTLKAMGLGDGWLLLSGPNTQKVSEATSSVCEGEITKAVIDFKGTEPPHELETHSGKGF